MDQNKCTGQVKQILKKKKKSSVDNRVIADKRIFLSGQSRILSKCKCLEKIAPIINLYSIPLLTKSYDYILQTTSSNSFWATVRPILLNFVKTLFFFKKKVQPPFCHFCTFINITPILKNQSYIRTYVQIEITVPSRGMDFQQKDKYNYPLHSSRPLTTYRHIPSFHRQIHFQGLNSVVENKKNSQ